MTSSYTATLSSLLTVQQIQLASRGKVGYQAGSFVREAINNLNFTDDRLRPYSTLAQYAEAISHGTKNGGVDAIIDELPYVKLFLARHSGDYAMIASKPINNGFGFAFQKGSPLVGEISREIAKLREEGRLMAMEKFWFDIRPSLLSSQDNDNNLRILKFDNFRGMFLISGVSFTLALSIFLIHLLYENLLVSNFISKILVGARFLVTMRYLYTRSANAIGQSNATS